MKPIFLIPFLLLANFAHANDLFWGGGIGLVRGNFTVTDNKEQSLYSGPLETNQTTFGFSIRAGVRQDNYSGMLINEMLFHEAPYTIYYLGDPYDTEKSMHSAGVFGLGGIRHFEYHYVLGGVGVAYHSGLFSDNSPDSDMGEQSTSGAGGGGLLGLGVPLNPRWNIEALAMLGFSGGEVTNESFMGFKVSLIYMN